MRELIGNLCQKSTRLTSCGNTPYAISSKRRSAHLALQDPIRETLIPNFHTKSSISSSLSNQEQVD
jgi:hypothetical protein